VPQPLHLTLPAPQGYPAGSAEPRWELAGDAGRAVASPVQAIPGMAADGLPDRRQLRLVATIPAADRADGVRRFRFRRATRPAAASPFTFRRPNGTTLELWEADRPVLAYNYGVMVGKDVPANDPRRRRSCYIHPVWGLRGEVLTADFPPDHYHHHGIFWAWPHVRVGDQQVDLWLGNGIRQQFVRWLERSTGPVAAVLAVENGWFMGSQQVMTERIWIRVYRAGAKRRAIDLEMTWIPGKQAVTLQGAAAKSYGGLTMRFAPRSPQAAVITTADGRQTEDVPDTPQTWADFSSPFTSDGAISGATIFVPTGHPGYPPTWLLRHYGAICVGWPGVRAKTFPAGTPFQLVYRISIHDGAGEREQLDQVYHAYLAASRCHWE